MHQQAPSHFPGLADAGGQVTQLRQVLALIEELAGGGSAPPASAALDQAARISAAYERALPIDQRRFDLFAADTARWAAAGVEALLKLEERRQPCRAAASVLAAKLASALAALARTVGV
jgi:hypothetical protein